MIKLLSAYSRDKNMEFLASDIKEAAAQEIVEMIASSIRPWSRIIISCIREKSMTRRGRWTRSSEL